MLSDGERGVVAGAIALARVDFGALDALDAEAVGRALEAADDADLGCPLLTRTIVGQHQRGNPQERG